MALEAKQPDHIYRSFAFIEPLSKNTEVRVASRRTDLNTLTFDPKVISVFSNLHFNVPTLRNHFAIYGHPLTKMKKEFTSTFVRYI